MRKMFTVVALCLAILLLVAVVAYAYVQSSIATHRTFNFTWDGDYVCSRNKTIAYRFGVTMFKMSVTFERINETNMVITAKMNDLREGAYLGIVFDADQNGKIDDSGLCYHTSYFLKDNVTRYYDAQRAGLGPFRNGERFFESFAECFSYVGHTVDFDSDSGYTWTIPVRFRNMRSGNWTKVELINDLIHIEYDFAVAVEFHFGMGVIA